MTISEDDRIHLISELEKLLGAKPIFYLQFCSQKNMLRMYAMAIYMQILLNFSETSKRKQEPVGKVINLS